MYSVLLIGCGSEIGASLVGMHDPAADGFRITTILTHPIDGDPKHPHLGALDALYARIVLAEPDLIDAVRVDRTAQALIVRGNIIRVVWGDSRTCDPASLGERYDVAILATSKKEIGDDAIIRRFTAVARFVVGVAEAAQLPSLYVNLVGAPTRFLPNPPRTIGTDRVFALGSCQSNGWAAQLRGLLTFADHIGATTWDVRRLEVDIVHPDTPTGRLGTKSFEARSQDPRNNLRPSFSQMEMAMHTLFPEAPGVNTVALRTLTMPPGYQLSRFFVRYRTTRSARATYDDVVAAFRDVAARAPHTLRMADVPLGSRGFERCTASAVVLESARFLQWSDDAFGIGGSDPVSELLVQAYVHNVRGYCRSVLDSIQYLIHDPHPQCFTTIPRGDRTVFHAAVPIHAHPQIV